MPEQPPVSRAQHTFAVLVALGAPWLVLGVLTVLATRAFDVADTSGDRASAVGVVALAAVLPPLQLFIVARLSRSTGVRVLGGLIALLSWPLYVGLLGVLSWTHD